MKKRKLKVLPVVTLAVFTVLLFLVAVIVIYRVNREIIYPTDYSEIVERVSLEEGVAEHILYAVIFTESSFDASARSSAGAVGLMQLLPSTAEWLCMREGREYDEALLVDPEFSIRYGARFLKILYERYDNWDSAHAAYHAGFGRVDSWLEEGTAFYKDGQLMGIPIEATENYVNKLRSMREKYFKQLDEKEKKNGKK